MREHVATAVSNLEQRIQCTGPNDSEWVVCICRRSRHAAGVHQTVLVLSTLIEHHLTCAVKDLSSIMRWLVGLSCPVIDEKVSGNDDEVVVHICRSTVQCSSLSTCPVDEIDVNAGERHNTC